MPARKSKRRILRRSLWSAGVLFAVMNIIAALHAWRFTHFTVAGGTRHQSSDVIPFGTKLRYALTGVDNPRPLPAALPHVPYRRDSLQGPSGKLALWMIPQADATPAGTVILFHGYAGEKSGMLGKAMIYHRLGFRVWLADFYGGGESDGNRCTIGFREAEDVAAVRDYIVKKEGSSKPLLLHGTSMGAVAILKYIHDTQAQPDAVVLECPFGTMYGTVCARFRMIGIPAFPMAGLLTFWGGMENGFNAFAHNPETYAGDVRCPALLVWGAKDDRVSRPETDAVFGALRGEKTLCVLPSSGHNDYLRADSLEYVRNLTEFSQRYSSRR